MHAATFDAMSLLMALAVILVPLVLAGVLLGRPPRNARRERTPRAARASGTGATSDKKR